MKFSILVIYDRAGLAPTMKELKFNTLQQANTALQAIKKRDKLGLEAIPLWIVE